MDSALRNAALDYAPVESMVHANLAGERSAATILRDIEADVADPDATYLAVNGMLPVCSDTDSLAKLRGFCRAMQKAIEAGVA